LTIHIITCIKNIIDSKKVLEENIGNDNCFFKSRPWQGETLWDLDYTWLKSIPLWGI
jgi:hypothetical protein